ncbi:MAG: T9SS type A sorting domain-containing protein [Flavobacteriales bacterium]|nr:T9SS type A sorting domain-containing protein [Flavobacteriales bacterium]
MTRTLVIILLFFHSTAFNQQFTGINTTVTPVENSTTAWGDYDNDGDLDLAISGTKYNGTNNINLTHLYNNDGNGLLTLVDTTSFPAMYNGHLQWADFNQDNLIDLLLVGFDTDNWQETAQIYENQGNGIFSEMSNTNLVPVQGASVSCNDFDNDGDIDIFISGNATMMGFGRYACMYFNAGNGNFEPVNSFIGVTGGSSMESGDFDGDGDNDLIYSGIYLSPSQRITKYYTNLGNGNFIDDTSSMFVGVHAGSISAADFDNDGDLDILISGWEESIDENTRLYENFGNGLFQENTSINLIGLINCDINWGDYDVDGDLDILMTGSSNNNNQQHTKIYENQGSGNFTELINTGLQNIFSGTSDWVDIDNDDDLDIFISGRGNNNTDQHSKLYRNWNSTPNLKPNAPTDLTTRVNGNSITLSWARANDHTTPQPSLSYNYYLNRIEDSYYSCSPLSDFGTGNRKVLHYGNTSLDTCWTIKDLSPGNYRWSVQSIDNCYTGSIFAEEQMFTVEDYSELCFNIYPVPSYNLLTINVQSPFTGDMNIEIRNVMGQPVFSETYAIVENIEWQKELQLTKIASGYYNITITVNNQVISKSVIILGND